MQKVIQNSLQDFRYALRQLRKSLGFTLLAVLTLALGIGATTAVFSLVDTVLLHPLPFPQSDRLVALDTLSKPRLGGGGPATVPSDTSYPNFFDWRDRAHSFDSIASFHVQQLSLAASSTSPARRISGEIVSADMFRVLGVAPVLGRDFTRAEEASGNRSIIISHSLWQTALGASPDALGRVLHLSDQSYVVVGVLPSGFQFPDNPEAEAFVTPAIDEEGKNSSAKQRGWNQLNVLARLKPGVSIEHARAEMQTIQLALAAQYPHDNKAETAVSVQSELDNLTGDVQRPLDILFGAVCLLLLIACANVAGLLLTRSAARRPELAVRAALGATRMQIVRQLLIESLTLSALGGLCGLALAVAALKAAPKFLPADLPRLYELSLNPRVFGFAVAASLATGLIFGVLPAWRSSRLDPALALRDTARAGNGSRARGKLHAALVIGETALSLTLLVGAGLLIRSFDRLMAVDPGFNPKHVLSFRIAFSDKRAGGPAFARTLDQILDRLNAVPGVQASTYGFPMPLAGGDMSISFAVEGHPTPLGEEPSARVSVVPANFFSTLQLPLRRGRIFTSAEDRPGGAPVILINQAFADRFFPGQDPIGKHMSSDLDSDPKTSKATMRTIVGVVSNVSRRGLVESPEPEYYLPFAQVPVAPPPFAIRVVGDPATYDHTVRAVVASYDATLPVFAVRTDLLARSTAEQRFQALLLSGFAALALLLAAIGLYAVISTMVAERTMELGLRMALGAQRGDVLSLVLGRGLVLAGLGLTVGLAASFALTRYLATLLFHTPALDPATFAVMTLVLLAVSTTSCLVPAWRASRLNPNDTLRQQ